MSSAQERLETPPVLLSKIAKNGDFLTVRVSLFGNQHLFAVSTGSEITELDISFKQRLIRKTNVSTISEINQSRNEIYGAPPMTISGTEVGRLEFPEGSPIRLMDFEELNKASEFDIRGMIGIDFLKQYALRVDVANGMISLFNPNDCDVDSSDQSIEMPMDFGRPVIEVASGNQPYFAMVDTSTTVTHLLSPPPYERLLNNMLLQQFEVVLPTENGSRLATATTGRLKTFRVGPFVHYGLCVHPGRVTKIGIEYLRRYSCTLDFPNEKMYLRPSSFFTLHDEIDRGGISFEIDPISKQKRVKFVVVDSTAEKLGIRPGDLMLTVDGKSIAKMSNQHFSRLLETRLEAIDIVVRRDGKDLSLRLGKLQPSVPAAEINRF